MALPMSLSDRVLHGLRLGCFAAAVILLLGLGAGLALWLGPEPHSDWLYYWQAAGDVDRYERGGLGLWLLAGLKAVGFTPVGAALAINLSAGLCVLALAWVADGSRSGWIAAFAAAYLAMIAPYMGLVQLDLVAAMALGAGILLAFRPPESLSRATVTVVATMAVAFAVSTKPQFALSLWALLGLLIVPWVLWRHRSHPAIARLLLVLLLGSVSGFTIDNGLRMLSGRTEAIRTNSAVTLYGGLLVSGTGDMCGYWSVEAAEAAKSDLYKPLFVAIRDRLAEKPVSHWLAVLKCKLPNIVSPLPYAMYWLVESPNIRTSIDAHPQGEAINARYLKARDVEETLYRWLCNAILLLLLAASAFCWWRGQRVLAMLPFAWVFSFWGVHLVFEIQGRYFLGMYQLSPLIAALMIGAAQAPMGRSRPVPAAAASSANSTK